MSSYYRVIEGLKYDRKMLEVAEEAVAGQGDGRISIGDARLLLPEVTDGNAYTDIEKRTMKYIRDTFTFTDEADTFLRGEIRRWAAAR